LDDVVVDSAGRVYLLDSRMSVVRVFSADGGLIATVGRPGRGPGELANPLSIATDNQQRLYVGDLTRQVHVFQWLRDTLTYLQSFRSTASPKSMCVMDNRLYVHGVIPGDPTIIRAFTLTGDSLTAFGEVYRTENPLITAEASSGRLLCVPTYNLVVFASSSMVPELRAYHDSGTAAWITQLEGYRPITMLERPKGYEVKIPDGGFHRLHSLGLLDPERVLLQVALVTKESNEAGHDYAALVSLILDSHTGDGRVLSRSLPALGPFFRTGVLSVRQDSFPHAVVYRVVTAQSRN
jgi:hypothetical protein